MDESEQDLIRRCKGRDADAFGVIVRKYAGRAVGAACLLLGHHADALDASQEAFVRAWRKIRQFDGRASFYTWYSAILRNVCLSRLRRRARDKTVPLADDRAVPQDQTDPGLLAERNERTDRIWRAIVTLPVKHREMIVMSHFQEMSYRQIADLLEIPIGTVMSRLHSARQVLREKLAGEQT